MLQITDYLFHPMVMERTPYYPFATYEMPLARIMRDPSFATAILLSSKSLYEALGRKHFLYEHLSEKEKFSVRQYFNRMCYRPTPFGLFAGVSTMTWDRRRPDLPLTGGYRVKSMIDYKHGMLMAERMIRRRAGFSPVYGLNTSLYRVGDEYRYIKYVWGGMGKGIFSSNPWKRRMR